MKSVLSVALKARSHAETLTASREVAATRRPLSAYDDARTRRLSAVRAKPCWSQTGPVGLPVGMYQRTGTDVGRWSQVVASVEAATV